MPLAGVATAVGVCRESKALAQLNVTILMNTTECKFLMKTTRCEYSNENRCLWIL